jgi:TolB-like protein
MEEEGLPVHRRIRRRPRSTRINPSLTDDDRARLDAVEPAHAGGGRTALWWATAGLMLLVALGLALTVRGVRDRLAGRPRAGDITSVTVILLKILSGDSTQDYFADGMTEALVTELGKISALQVRSYQSVIGYQQTSKALPAIAQELNVDALLEGSVLRSGDRLQISSNLLRMGPEWHIWAERFEFSRRDINPDTS